MASAPVSGPPEPIDRPGALRAWWLDAVDRLAGSDPGLNRLRSAGQAVVSIAVILAVEYGFVRITGALQTTASASSTVAVRAEVAAGNHALLVIALLLGAMVAMLTSIGVNDRTAPRQVVSTLIVPLPIIASMALGLALGGHRALALTSFPIVLTLGTLARRWGPRGVLIGVPLFIGDFIGFFLYGVVHIGDLGWIAAELMLSALVSAGVRLALFFPDAGAALHRSQLSWAARARRVSELSAEVFESDDGTDPETARRRLGRELVRLNEAALIIDAQLAEPGAVGEDSSAQLLHERLFDAELGLTNVARFAEALRAVPLRPDDRADIAATLDALRHGDLPLGAAGAAGLLTRLGQTAAEDLTPPGGTIDPERRAQRILVHRFASSAVLLTSALDEWMEIGAEVRSDDDRVFTPAVALAGNWLPGSALVSAQASATPGRRLSERLALAPYVRTAVQVGVAVGLATVIGDVVSGRRFYWAVIAAFVSFVGVNNSLEQVRKAGLRVVGTVVGIVIGSFVAHLDGNSDVAAIVVILIAMFFSVYLIRVSYGFMVIGVTVMVSQLYEQLGELSNSLLLLRLGETALGATIAAVTVLVVFPLRTQRVLVVALAALLRSTRALVDEAVNHLGEPGSGRALALHGRSVDSDYQALVTTARPLRRFGDAGRWAQRMVAASTGVRHYARNLARDVPGSGGAGDEERELLDAAATRLLRSIDDLIAVYTDGATEGYVRSASQWSSLEQHALDQLRRRVATAPGVEALDVDLIMAARDLQRLDGALAELADLARVPVTDLDTTPAGTGAGTDGAGTDRALAGGTGADGAGGGRAAARGAAASGAAASGAAATGRPSPPVTPWRS